jgi:hypothetical protein
MADTSGRLNGFHRDKTTCLTATDYRHPEELIMNWNTLIAASFFAVLNVAAFSAHAADQTTQTVSAHGTHLDIKKVISIEDTGSGCGLVNARLSYLDSSGSHKVLDYSKFADCGNQGS